MKIIGHRGAAGLAPENTLASIQKAIDHRADMVEIDVRVTKDGVPVLHHDSYLSDPSGQRLKLANHGYEELRRHKQDLPSLQAALDSFGGKTPLYLEIKPREPVKPIIRCLRTYLKKGGRAEHIRICSFDYRVLSAVHAALPDLIIAVSDSWSGVRATSRARRLQTNHIIMNQRWLWSGFLKAMTRSGYKVAAYTVNSPQRAKFLESHGVRAIFTDYPDRFKAGADNSNA